MDVVLFPNHFNPLWSDSGVLRSHQQLMQNNCDFLGAARARARVRATSKIKAALVARSGQEVWCYEQ